jgi:N-acetylneuraminic acid mutarotase
LSATFVIGDKFYLGCGVNDNGYLSDFWEYDPVNDLWTQKADFPGGARMAATGFSIGNKGYLCFGAYSNWTWYKDVWEYDPTSDTWTQKNDFPGHERYSAMAFVIGGKSYVGTGAYRLNLESNAEYYNDFWEYDPVVDNWIQKTNVPEVGRTNAFALEIDGKGYIGFGFYYYDTRKKDWWQYDVTTDSWTRKADYPGEPRYEPAGFSMNKKGYVGTGYNYGFLKDFWVYIPATDVWVQKINFPGTPRYEAIGFAIGNKGYMGMGSESVYYQDLWQFSEVLEPVTITCPPNQSVYLASREQGCGQIVTNLKPTFTPTDATPMVNWSNIWRGTELRRGMSVLHSESFPAGNHLLIYTMPEYEGQTCSFEVNLLDTFPPILDAPPTLHYCNFPSNQYTIPWLKFNDNCDIVADISHGAFIGWTITGATTRSGLWPDASGLFNPGTSIITWTVRDPSGNVATAQTIMIVDPPLTVNIPTAYAVLFGEPNTAYKGYGPDGIFITAMVKGGSKFPDNTYNYSWSNGATTRTIWVSQPTVGTHTYSVMVTDKTGCFNGDDITINVKDVRCGPQLNKVAVCFNSRQGQIDRCLKPSEAFFALLWGGKLGTCDQLLTSAQSGKIQESIASHLDKSIQVYPNPAKNAIRVLLNNYPSGQYEVGIWDMNGKKINQKSVYVQQSNYQMVFNLENQASGIYLIRVSGKEGTQTYKVVKH